MFYGNERLSNRALLVDFPPYTKYKRYIAFAREKNLELLMFFSPPERYTIPLNATSQTKEYTPEGLKEKIRDYLVSTGIKDMDSLILPAGELALYYILFSITNIGDEMLVPEPYPFFLKLLAEMVGINIISIETTQSNGFRLPLRNAIEGKVSARSKAIYIPNPHPITGNIYTTEEIERLMFVANNYHLFMIKDERLDFYSPPLKKSTGEIGDYRDRLFILKGIGDRNPCLLITPNASFLEYIRLLSDTVYTPPNIFSEYVYRRLFISASEETKQFRKQLEERKEVFFNETEKRSEIFTMKSEAYTGSVMKIPVRDAEKFVEWLLTDFSHRGKTLFFLPIKGLYSDKNKGADEVVINYGIKPDEIREGFEILDIALEMYKKEEE